MNHESEHIVSHWDSLTPGRAILSASGIKTRQMAMAMVIIQNWKQSLEDKILPESLGLQAGIYLGFCFQDIKSVLRFC